MLENPPIYLDYNATTPIAKEVADSMMPFLYDHFGNPSSTHPYGVQAKLAVEKARKQIAATINAQPNEIIFTSGGTESNNIAIRGYALANQGKGHHIITSTIEHPAVLEVCQHLETLGFSIDYLPVDKYGWVDPADLQDAMTPSTILVSIMHANNEVGTIQSIRELADITHASGAVFHTDAAQSIGKIPVNVQDLGVDLLSIAGHKLYAPKGVGALFVRNGIKLEKILFGAGQEQGLRPGTENVMQIVGLGQAAEIAKRDLSINHAHFRDLRDKLHQGLIDALSPSNVRLNGHQENRLPNTLSLSFRDAEADQFLHHMSDTIAASAGAACHADQVSISNVIKAMGVPVEWAKGAIRFSIGRQTTEQDIEEAVRIVKKMYQIPQAERKP
jgi:cysteine desulfurase